MPDLAAAPAFTGMTAIGSGGGVTVRLRDDLTVVAVLARKGADVAAALGIADGPRHSRAGALTSLGIGPGRWLLLGQKPEALREKLAGLASLSDHSDGYAVFEVSGPCVREGLAKGVPLDLHPAVFTDAVAVTAIAHIGAIIWQCGENRFAIAVFRSYAGSFWHWLAASAAQFGLEVETP